VTVAHASLRSSPALYVGALKAMTGTDVPANDAVTTGAEAKST